MTPTHRNWRVTTTTTTTAGHDPETGDFIGVTEVLGGVVRDDDRKVTYRVTIGRRRLTESDPMRGVTHRRPTEVKGPPVFLTSLTIEPHDGAPVDQSALRRVPVQRLADAVATQYAREAALWAYDDDQPTDARVHLKGDIPTSEQIEAMLWEGETRVTIGARFHRSPSTVSDWIGRSYRERPGTMPARRKGGRPPTPQTPDGDRRPGQPIE